MFVSWLKKETKPFGCRCQIKVLRIDRHLRKFVNTNDDRHSVKEKTKQLRNQHFPKLQNISTISHMHFLPYNFHSGTPIFHRHNYTPSTFIHHFCLHQKQPRPSYQRHSRQQQTRHYYQQNQHTFCTSVVWTRTNNMERSTSSRRG